MQLNNTTILTAGNPDSAKSLLKSHFAMNDILTVVVFGNGSLANKVVEQADIRAEGTIAGISRKVVWMQDPGLLSFLGTLINDGKSFTIESIDTNKHIGISISKDKYLMDIIPGNPEPDYIRIELAFINAGT